MNIKLKEESLTPREIVRELDKYIIGQDQAKRAVAVALRTRWRRQQLSLEMREEVTPKNIIMIGPTGVGKTEIARRLSRLVKAPFLKVEASKFTEVGYMGRDVESIIRDLTHQAINMVKEEIKERVKGKAEDLARERLLDLLLPPVKKKDELEEVLPKASNTRDKFRKYLREGKFDDKIVDMEVDEPGPLPMIEIFSNAGLEEMDINLRDMLPKGIFPTKSKRRKMKVEDARKHLKQEEIQKLIDMDEVVKEAVERVEQSGIIFVDEIDKVASRDGGEKSGGSPDVSREGVQRDLLPIVEGCNVSTKYGMVKTDHILFIAAGAFHQTKPSDLIPELQGRFPIRVELNSLSQDDFIRILTEPKNALIKQYTELLSTERIDLEFDPSGISELAGIATEVNQRMENIGARRLHTIMERLLDELSFEAPDIKPQTIKITAHYVREKLQGIIQDRDLSDYIL